MLSGKKVIIDHKSRVIFRSPVDAAKVGEQVKLMVVPELRANIDYELAGNHDANFAESIDDLCDPGGVFGL